MSIALRRLPPTTPPQTQAATASIICRVSRSEFAFVTVTRHTTCPIIYVPEAMKSYTYSEARQNFAAILEQACRDGAVRIQRRDGQTFVVTPEDAATAPFDSAGGTLAQPISRDEIVQSIQESRRSYE